MLIGRTPSLAFDPAVLEQLRAGGVALGDVAGQAPSAPVGSTPMASRQGGMFGRQTPPPLNPTEAPAPPPMPVNTPGSPNAWQLDMTSQFPMADQGGDTMEQPAMPPRVPPGGFDYKAAFKQMLPQQTHMSTREKIAMALSGIGAAFSGNQNVSDMILRSTLARRQADRTQEQQAANMIARMQHDDWARQNGADLRAAAPFTIGRDRLRYDPATGQTTSIYHGPAEFETYAQSLGLQPGTPKYNQAAQDYVLRGNGPTALANDQALDDYRTGNRRTLENQRQGNRVSLEGIRQGNRRDLEGVRQGNRITTRQTPTYRDQHGVPGRGGGFTASATGPNGQQIHYDPAKGSWVDPTGNPVR